MVSHPAVFSSIGVIGCDLHHRCSRGTVGTETDRVQDWIEGGPVVIDVHDSDPHAGYRAQTTLYENKTFN